MYFLMIHTDLIVFSLVGDPKAPFLRCFHCAPKYKEEDIIATGQYMNNHTFGPLQFRPLLKNFFHSFHIDLTNMKGEKVLVVSQGDFRFFDV